MAKWIQFPHAIAMQLAKMNYKLHMQALLNCHLAAFFKI